MKEIMLSGRNYGNQIEDDVITYKANRVFGFTRYKCPLYGGRQYTGFHTTDEQIIKFRDAGIMFDIVMSNHHFSDDAYRKSMHMLEDYHYHGNGIVITNYKLALRIRKDFPKYKLKASCIRNPRTLYSIERGLEIFDDVTLQPNAIRNPDFINSICPKIRDRVILFGNAECLYLCSKPTCYIGVSQYNFGKHTTQSCSGDGKVGYQVVYQFNYESAKIFNGFNKIKLILPRQDSIIKHIDADTGNEIKEISWH
jgi:hypothetical protein